MTSWTRARVATLCGSCRQTLEPGAPLFVLQVPGVKRALVRCEGCIGPAPPDLPAVVVLREPPAPLPFVRFRPDMLPLDFKSRQYEREPGEEG